MIVNYKPVRNEFENGKWTGSGNGIKKQTSKDKEIERLKEDNEYLNKVNIELSAEKNRLNNIINELEETLSNKIKQIDEKNKKSKIKPYGIEFELNECAKNRYREILDKIKELKGEDKK